MFQPRFSISAATASALMGIEATRRELTRLKLSPQLLVSLRETAALAATHYSTQIEGNRLTLPEVRAAQLGQHFPGRERDETEVRNHFIAFAHMESSAEENGALTENAIQTLHGLVMTGKAKPSPYRNQQNVIRDSPSGLIVYLPPEAKDVPPLMHDLVAWVNDHLREGATPVPLVAALAHYQFATIHPYLDGNGRTARLMTTLILRRAGYGLGGIYALEEHYAENLAGYYRALSVGHHNYYEGRADADVSRFVEYFCAGMNDAFNKIRAAVARSGATAKPGQPNLLRDLDPRQRRVLVLLHQQGSATGAEIALHLGLTSRTVAGLCRDWVREGFLEQLNPSRKARSYRLAERYV